MRRWSPASVAGGIGAAFARLAADGARPFLTGWPAHDAGQAWGEDPDSGQRIRAELHHAGAVNCVNPGPNDTR